MRADIRRIGLLPTAVAPGLPRAAPLAHQGMGLAGFRHFRRLLLLGLELTLAAAPAAVWAADDWVVTATLSPTATLQSGRLCYTDGRDLACNDNAGGLLSTSATIYATQFVGDGSGLTGVTADATDRITSGTTSMVVVSTSRYISLTQAGSNTGWFDPARGLVTLGVSATGAISGTRGYFSGGVGIGTGAPLAMLDVRGKDILLANSSALDSDSPRLRFVDTISGTVDTQPVWNIDNYRDAFRIFREPDLSTSGATYFRLSATHGYFAGNVGIGTNFPTAMLHFTNSVTTIASNTNMIRLWDDPTTGRQFGFGITGGQLTYRADNHIFYTDSTSNTLPRMIINTSGRVGVGTLMPTTTLEVSGTVSATRFVGDGSGLTNVTAGSSDRIASGTTSMLAVSNTGYISITQAGSNTGWFDPTRGLVTLGVSATGPISATQGYFSGPVGISATSTPLTIYHGTGGNGLIYLNGPASAYRSITYNTNGSRRWDAGTSNTPESTGEAGSDFFINRFSDAGTYIDTPFSITRSTGTTNITNLYVDTLMIGTSSSAVDVPFDYESIAPRYAANHLRLQSPNNIYFHTSLTSVEPDDNSKVRMTILANGNVGIGTTGPNTALSVMGTVSATSLRARQGAPVNDSASVGYAFGQDGDSGMFSPGSATANNGIIAFFSNAVERMRIAGSNIGIGTTSPTTALDVNGNVQIGGRLYGGAVMGSDHFWIALGPNGTESANLAIGIASGNAAGTLVSQVMIVTGGQDRMIVNAAGNVGIGTTAPTVALEVSGTVSATSITGTISATNIRARQGSPINDSAAVGYAFGLDGDTGLFSPGSAGAANGTVAIFSNSVERMRVINTGVGIGTQTPTVALEVSGTISATSIVTPPYSNASTSVNWSRSNVQSTSSSCGAFTFSNMQDGGIYSLLIEGTTSGTCSFTHSGLTFRLPPGHGATTASTMTQYGFVRRGTNVFVTWQAGY